MVALLILVTGMPGSGKSLVAKGLAERLRAPIYVMGDIVRREVARRGLELTVENIELVAQKLREELGPAAVAHLLKRELAGEDSWVIIIDGVRSLDEVQVLSSYGKACIVAVHASPMTRYKRILARKRRGDAVSLEDLRLRDEKNLGYGIGGVIAMADYMIVNEGDLGELAKSIDEVARRIANEKGKSCSGGGSQAYRRRS